MAANPMEGRIAEIQFDSGRHFRIDFLPENQLRWTSIRKQDYGVTDVESTHVEILGDGLFAIDWIEKSGLCVSYSVDVNARFVRSYMSWADSGKPDGGRDFLTHEGPFFFILDSGEPDPRPFTNLEVARSFFSAIAEERDAARASSLMSEDFVFRSNDLRQYKTEFLAALEEEIGSGKSRTSGVLLANVDKNRVFIETENHGQGSVMYVFIVNNGQVAGCRKIG